MPHWTYCKYFVSIQWSWRPKPNQINIWFGMPATVAALTTKVRTESTHLQSASYCLFNCLLFVHPSRNAFFHHSGMQYLSCQAFQMLKCHSLSRASRALLTNSNAYKQPLTAELRVSHSPSVKKGSVQCQRWACCRKRYPRGSPLSISLCNLFHLPRREERQRERETKY